MRAWAPEVELERVVRAWFGPAETTDELRAELMARHRAFNAALVREDIPAAVLRYHPNAIFWPYGRLPVIGRERIGEMFRGAPDLGGAGIFRPLQLTLRGTQVFEQGERGSGEVRTGYQCIWRRNADGRLVVVREVWDYVVERDVN
jgi:ketosteroid isomerase-like protein